jgi:TolB-like protein/DNA-binding winged helix-turn-helix (wHTH) protein
MDESMPSRGVWRFGIFEVDGDAGELRRNGAKIRLQEQPFQVLTVLLSHAGSVVSREELRREVWGDGTFVEFDHALNTAIKKIRIAIGDDAIAPRYVETIPKRGYRFIAPIQPPIQLTSSPVANAVLPARRTPRWVLAGGLIFVASLSIMMSSGPRAANQGGGRRIMLAVLPFETVGADAGQQSICDGITQDLITQLARVDPERLGVTARGRILAYRNTNKTVAQIGSELGVDYLMEGNLRRDGSHVRVSAELIRLRDQSRLWGDSFDGAERSGEDVLAIESELANRIATRARDELLPKMR